MEEITHQSFGAHFVEVEVDEEVGHVRLVRWTDVYDGVTILNPRLARSQIIGGVIFGIGMTLMEEAVYDQITGLPINANLGKYHVPTHAEKIVTAEKSEHIGDPEEELSNRISKLEQTVGELQHFITANLRPNLSKAAARRRL